MKSVLNIVHTESHTQWGGQERRVLTESVWMRDRGHHVVLLSPGGTMINQRAREAGLTVYDIPFARKTMLVDCLKIRRLLKRLKPHVFNTHGNMDAKVGLVAARGLGIPCVIRSRHITPYVINTCYNRLIYNSLCRYIFTTASCINDQLVRDLDVSKEKLFTIPSGISPPEQLPDPDTSRNRIIAQFGLPPSARFLGYVGRVSPEKGLPVFLDAYAEISGALPDHYVLLVGEGRYRSEIEKHVAVLGIEKRVLYTGYQDDTWPYFRALDCHVSVSSKYEGTPQVILQAMYARCPVIGTRIGGIPDVVDHETTGLLVPPDRPDELGRMILKTIRETESTRRRVERAHRFVRDQHTIDAMGNKILRVYQTSMPWLSSSEA